MSDEQLVEDLRRLGTDFGVAISTLGLPLDRLDELPPHWAIAKLSEREFEHLQDRLQIQKITTHAPTKSFDWRTLERMRQDNADFQSLLDWLHRSLTDKRAYTFEEFATLTGNEMMAEE
jgi:hypothetical protein